MESISVADGARKRRLFEDEEEEGEEPFVVHKRHLVDEFYEAFETLALTSHLPPKRPMPPCLPACLHYGPYCFKPWRKWKLTPLVKFSSNNGEGSMDDYELWRRKLEDEKTTVMAATAETIAMPSDAATFLKELALLTPRQLLNWLSNTLFDRSFFDNVVDNEILVETFRLAMFNNNPRHVFIVMVLGLFINRATVRDCVNTMLNRCCDYKDNLKLLSKRHIITILYLLQVRQIPHMPVLEDKCVQSLENVFCQVFDDRRCLWIVAMESVLRRGAGLNEMLRVCRRRNLPESVKCMIRSYFNDIVLHFIDHEVNKKYMDVTEPIPRWGCIWLAPMYEN